MTCSLIEKTKNQQHNLPDARLTGLHIQSIAAAEKGRLSLESTRRRCCVTANDGLMNNHKEEYHQCDAYISSAIARCVRRVPDEGAQVTNNDVTSPTHAISSLLQTPLSPTRNGWMGPRDGTREDSAQVLQQLPSMATKYVMPTVLIIIIFLTVLRSPKQTSGAM